MLLQDILTLHSKSGEFEPSESSFDRLFNGLFSSTKCMVVSLSESLLNDKRLRFPTTVL